MDYNGGKPFSKDPKISLLTCRGYEDKIDELKLNPEVGVSKELCRVVYVTANVLFLVTGGVFSCQTSNLNFVLSRVSTLDFFLVIINCCSYYHLLVTFFGPPHYSPLLFPSPFFCREFAWSGSKRRNQSSHTKASLEPRQEMGYVIIVSLPLILFILIVALACFLLGRAKGRNEAPSIPLYYGQPVPAPPVQPK